ncbi:MAG: AbrB/MazE/SpoVT family DNA-binding domain-containing protein [Leptolyngbyaceae bacterium]|nr:AbrB/MazE/SpoVT family DNA-binding domain-containing protein [Leptolyngbyaceae bacterium]
MSHGIRTRIIKIGNSQGIRIPKPLLEQSGIEEDVEIEIQDNVLILRAASKPRAGWQAAFEAMADNNDDALLDDAITSEWDEREWEW